MIRSSVTVSLVEEARGGPFVFWHDLPDACRKASALGFDGIELFPPDANAVEARMLRTLLDEHALTLAAVGTGAGWLKKRLHLCMPDAGDRAKAKAFIRSIIDFAGTFGAPAIIGSMQGRSGDRIDVAACAGHLSDALEELGEYARQYGVPLVYEPLNRYETDMVNTIARGVALLRSLSTRNVVLLADLFHMNIEESDLPSAIRAGMGLIGHVHFVDSNRRPAGNGHIDYARIARALSDIDYSGFASAEALPYPDSDTAAKRTIDTFRQFFRPATA